MNSKYVTKSQVAIATLLLTIMLVVIIFFLHEIIISIFPLGDEFALIVSAQESPINWILSGYSDYFRVYDEYFVPYTNFLRPIANLLYFAFSFTPDPLSYQLIFVNYLVHALVCTLIYLFSLSFGNNSKFSLVFAVTAFLAPAFWLTPAVASPSCALDPLAALLGLLSLYALFKDYKFLGFMCLITAVFTKETALPMMIVWLFFGVQRRDIKALFFGSLSLVVWILIRTYAFDGSGGTYSFNNFSFTTLFFRLSSLTSLPLGNFTIDHLKSLIIQREASIEVIYLLANIAAWFLSLRVFLDSSSKIWNPRNLLGEKNDLFILFIALIGSIGFYWLIGGSTRFSYLTFTIWIVAVSATKNSLSRSLLVLLLFISSIVSFPVGVGDISKMQKYKYEQSRALTDFISGNVYEGDTYVFNDFVSGYSQQQYVANYSGAFGNFYRGNSLDIKSCLLSETQLIKTDVFSDDSGNRILQVELPSCAKFSFEGAQVDKLISNIEGVHILRNQHIRYEFKDLEITESVLGNPKINFGKHLKIVVSQAVNSLMFDFSTNSWVNLE
jgi:hypothetical protein